MSSSSSAIRFQILAFLPVLGITLFIAHSQYRALTGEVYRVAIEGYDPRDLIHGHYLRYRFSLPSSQSVKVQSSPTDIYCFKYTQQENSSGDTHGDHEVSDHEVNISSDSATSECDSSVKVSDLSRSQKYLIPEEYASLLEKALRTQEASVDLIIHDDQRFTVGQLYLNGQPWESTVIKKHSEILEGR